GHAVFEATHGTAPKYAGKDMVNPGSVILSGEMMLRYLGWDEAAELIISALGRTIEQKQVTYDFERLMEDATRLSTSAFGRAVVANMMPVPVSSDGMVTAHVLQPSDDPGWAGYGETILEIHGAVRGEVDLTRTVDADALALYNDAGLVVTFGILTPENPFGRP